tara:strand:- start:1734 stop:1964 length:231 start_codon:yes stop_codon:yes gene_type:complete
MKSDIIEKYVLDMYNCNVWDLLDVSRSSWASFKQKNHIPKKYNNLLSKKLKIDDYDILTDKELCLILLDKYNWKNI